MRNVVAKRLRREATKLESGKDPKTFNQRFYATYHRLKTQHGESRTYKYIKPIVLKGKKHRVKGAQTISTGTGGTILINGIPTGKRLSKTKIKKLKAAYDRAGVIKANPHRPWSVK